MHSHSRHGVPLLGALLLSGLLGSAQATGAAQPAAGPNVASSPARAAGASPQPFIDIDLAGWQTYGGFGNALNGQAFIRLPAGTGILGFEFLGVALSTEGASWGEELVLSVNNSDGSRWMDWAPFGDAGSTSGTFGPVTGLWGGGVGTPPVDFFTGEPIPGAEGSPFELRPDGTLWVTVYESFNDAGDGLDATVTAGALRVHVTAVPEPSTYGLMALGMLWLGFAAHRRKR